MQAPWIHVPHEEEDKHFDLYPPEGIEEWHRKRGLYLD